MKIVALTENGDQLARRIAQHFPNAEIWYKPNDFTQSVQAAFQAGQPLIMICATGIVVRTLAPVLQSKSVDPPVVVLDDRGKFVVPLLSGHEGGGNELARQIAAQLGAQLVVTSAQAYLRPVYALGMGCERNCSHAEVEALAQQCLQHQGLKWSDIHAVSSINIKENEVALVQLASENNKPFETWSVEQLRAVESQLMTPSDYVYATVGVFGVAESAALVSAATATGQPAELIQAKQKSARATCAIARSYCE